MRPKVPTQASAGRAFRALSGQDPTYRIQMNNTFKTMRTSKPVPRLIRQWWLATLSGLLALAPRIQAASCSLTTDFPTTVKACQRFTVHLTPQNITPGVNLQYQVRTLTDTGSPVEAEDVYTNWFTWEFSAAGNFQWWIGVGNGVAWLCQATGAVVVLPSTCVITSYRATVPDRTPRWNVVEAQFTATNSGCDPSHLYNLGKMIWGDGSDDTFYVTSGAITTQGHAYQANGTYSWTYSVYADTCAPPKVQTGVIVVGDQLPLTRLIGLEVNQVVQNWSNSVPLITGKATTVRAHIQSLTNQPVRVTGQLHGFRNGAEMLPPLDPSPPFILARTNAVELRRLLNSSLNFNLPATWTTGTVTLQFTSTNNVACGEASGPNTCSATVAFLPPPTLQLNLVHIPWTNQVEDEPLLDETFDRSRAQIQDLITRLISCYPVTNVDFVISEMPWDLNTEPTISRALERLQAKRNADQAAAHQPSKRIYYGVIAVDASGGQAEDIPGNVACGNLKLSPFGRGRHTHSHEIAHALGRHHATDAVDFGIASFTNGAIVTRYARGACGENSATNAPVYPFMATINAALKPTLGPMSNGPNAVIYGYDHALGEIVSPYDYFDLTSYCFGDRLDRWVSSYTYQGLRSALESRFASPPSFGTNAAGFYLVVRGIIDMFSEAVTLEPVMTLNFNHDPDPVLPGNYAVNLLDGAGRLLQSVPFTPSQAVADGDEPTSNSFLVQVRQNPACRQVQVLHGGQVQAVRSASAHPPTVQVLSPQGGENFASDSVSIAWTGSDADGDPLTYMVQYSRDNGTNWETLNVDLTTTNYLVPRRVLAGTSAGRVRVLACDGFYTATGASAGTFSVANSPPHVSIQLPATGTLFFGSQPVVLTALAYDPQDGSLDGTNIVWSSDLDGTLGTGSHWLQSAATLSEGAHQITATAQNSSGLPTSTQIDIVIQRAVPSELTDLAITQTSQATDTGLVFTITAQNLGPSDATRVKITDTLPAGATVSTAAAMLGACAVTNGLLTCAIDRLALGESAVVLLELATAVTGLYTNVADVRGVEVDPVMANNLAQEVAEFTAILPRLSIELAGNSVIISWPATTPPTFVLQSAASLLPRSWSDVPDIPITVHDRFQVTQSLTSRSRYYRLLHR